MSDMTFDAADYDYIYLYGCETCKQFYVMRADPSEQPSCPSGHEYAKLAFKQYRDSRTCVTPSCAHFLQMDKAFPGDRCEGGCKKPPATIADLVGGDGTVNDDSGLAQHVVETETEGTGPAAGLARSLKAEIDSAEGFKSSHHKNRQGHHTASASATHDRGDKANANIRQKKALALAAALEKLRASDDFDEAKFRDLITRSEAYVKKWGKS
jgi:hypothetical protein